MRHFLKIAEAVDVMPLAIALQRQPELWNANTLRTTFEGSPHRAADDIWLWFNVIPEPGQEAAIVDDRDVVPYPAWRDLPQARSIVFDLMRRVEGVRLGRVMITRLAPGKTITPHVDGGAPATFYDRYHLAIRCLPGANFNIGEEICNFRDGEVWLIDNTTVHSVVNNSADDRIVMIMDIRSA